MAKQDGEKVAKKHWTTKH